MKVNKIIVVSNTHWDREFRYSFEKTRRNLLTMLDTCLDILEKNPDYHSFTLDGHSILLEDYLEMRPERRSQVELMIKEGRLLAGPWYTLAEEFSISHEPLIRNLLWGRKTVEKYGGKTGTVAYTPSSWGQTGQLPQILQDFGLKRMMFYRGISHHESDAEFIWQAPDGTEVMASRFAVYARYNWYYQVHRPVTRHGRVFEKDYQWGEFDEIPVRSADMVPGNNPSYEVLDPVPLYDPAQLEKSIFGMIEREDGHFTTPVFLAMHGHDISVAHPLESVIIKDANTIFHQFSISHGNLEEFWEEAEKYIDRKTITRLKGEKRSYLKKGMWTYLFPATISARTYLKQQDFEATRRLVYEAEPLTALAFCMGTNYPNGYMDRAWQFLLSNHTHDANGGCAPDAVCLDMEYRYRKVMDISDIASKDAIAHIVKNLSPGNLDNGGMQLVVFNPLPFNRDGIFSMDMEIPSTLSGESLEIVPVKGGEPIDVQIISGEDSSVFVDSIWDVPSILRSKRIKFHAAFQDLPALGYRAYKIVPGSQPDKNSKTLITGPFSMENDHISVNVNKNGTINILNKKTGMEYSGLNYLTDQGEGGNAWQHEDLPFDQKFECLNEKASISITESGHLSSAITAVYSFPVPVDYGDGTRRNSHLVSLPVEVEYRLDKNCKFVKVKLKLNNIAKDHWLRVNFPTGIRTSSSFADSHFDIVERDIHIPDSTGWVEQARGTHPLRSFVALRDKHHSFSVFTKGLFEYEVFEDEHTTLAITLIRACRIKLAVSEEKKTELPDRGVQCPGEHSFEYAIFTEEPEFPITLLPNLAAEYFQPICSVVSGRGKGNLPPEMSALRLDNNKVHITAIKKTFQKDSLLVRLFNPSDAEEAFTLMPGFNFSNVYLARMDETPIKKLDIIGGNIQFTAAAKKIVNFIIQLKKHDS